MVTVAAAPRAGTAGERALAGQRPPVEPIPARSQGVQDVLHAFLRVAEEHGAVLAEEQWVLHTGVPGGHRAFEDDDVLRLPDAQDRHALDRAARVGRARV